MLLEAVFFCLLLPSWSGSISLDSYNVDPKSVTVSGFSSGGGMAMQFHIAFSKEIHGAGIFAGLPYACGREYDGTSCMKNPEIVNFNTLIEDIPAFEAEGKIDPTFYLKNAPVFIFHGENDSTVLPASGKKIEEIYTHFGANIQTVFDMPAQHGFPTDLYGSPCSSKARATQYIVNCDYQGAYIMLQHLYSHQNLIRPAAGEAPKILPGDFHVFEQAEFVDARSPVNVSLGPEGFIYVPSQCRDKSVTCKFHIAFHGCFQSKTSIKDIFPMKTGYLEVAELNNIIILFPQAAPNELIGNSYGCWDWVGYENDDFLNQEGDQMKAVYRMLKRAVDSRVNLSSATVNIAEWTSRTTTTLPFFIFCLFILSLNYLRSIPTIILLLLLLLSKLHSNKLL